MGCPYGWIRGAHEGGRAPTRGCPYEMDKGCTRGGEGTHKGCPYGPG